MVKRIITFLLRVLVVVAMMAIIAVCSFQGVTRYLTGSFYDLRNVNKKEETATAETTPLKQEEVVEEKDVKNTLFFVESKDGLSRYTALVMLNKKTKAADLLLIPLHVQVTIGGKLLNDIQKKIPDAGSTLELDDIARAYGEGKYSMISEIFSEILAVNISGYDVITQEKFEDLLDIVNPVSYKFTDILSYRDDKQVLQFFESGDQNINGSEAMILMSHLDGTEKQESDRLERCNTYLESWIGKVLDKDKGGKMIDIIKKNATANEGRDYTDEKELWSSIKGDAVTLRILQGAENKGIFTIDSTKAKLQIATLAKQSSEYDSSGKKDRDDTDESLDDDDDENVASSKDYYIELYNAAFIEGLASDWEKFLEGEGYNISMIDSYQDEGLISTTRIVVSQEGMGRDLLKYFPGANIETGEIDTGGDIQIYLGTDSSNVGVSENYSDSDRDKESDDSDDEDNDDKDKDEDDQDDKDDSDKDSDSSSKNSGYYNFDKDTD